MLLVLDTIVDPIALKAAGKFIREGEEACSVLEKILVAKAELSHPNEVESENIPTGSRLAVKIALRTLVNAFKVAFSEIQIRLANMGIKALS